MHSLNKISVVSLCLAAALAAAPQFASAQIGGPAPGGGGLMPGMSIGTQNDSVDPATREKREEIDREYRAKKATLPDAQNSAVDPWANMRGPDDKAAAKPATKSAAKKPATASAQPKKPATAQ
jgi:hypothetical protein